jgi:hypothetical protein
MHNPIFSQDFISIYEVRLSVQMKKAGIFKNKTRVCKNKKKYFNRKIFIMMKVIIYM